MPGDTVTRLWRLRRGIITVAMARMGGRERRRNRGWSGRDRSQGEGGSRVMPRIHVHMYHNVRRFRRRPAGVRRAISMRKEREREIGIGSRLLFRRGWDIHSLSTDRHAVPHPRTHAREPSCINPALHPPRGSSLIR